MAVMVSWGIAFFEYWLAVPANRIGYQVYSAAELKTIQEVITFAVFAAFSVFFLKQAITINHLIGFALIAAGAFFVFRG
ncbi:MAG: DMT family protein, partial [Alphaproteobacteria bacterium]|nr:DMT family protein [Alphaproteobacteria bacterium]